MAIEDGVSIAALLPADTPASAVPERLELYQEVRHERGTRIQQGSRVNGMDADKRPKGESSEVFSQDVVQMLMVGMFRLQL